jgi:hypothetical protein
MIGSIFKHPQSRNVFKQKKGPRDFRGRSKSGEETPGEGSDSWEDYRCFYFADQGAGCIDGAQFLLRPCISHG